MFSKSPKKCLQALEEQLEPIYSPARQARKNMSSGSTHGMPKGVGYGSGSVSNTASSAHPWTNLQSPLESFAKALANASDSELKSLLSQFSSKSPVHTHLFFDDLFGNDSMLDIQLHDAMYHTALKVLSTASERLDLIQLLFSSDIGIYLSQLNATLQTYASVSAPRGGSQWKYQQEFTAAFASYKDRTVQPSNPQSAAMQVDEEPSPDSKKHSKPNVTTRSSTKRQQEASAAAPESKRTAPTASPSEIYAEVLQPMQFGESNLSDHAFVAAAKAVTLTARQVTRIAQELSVLATQLPLNPSGSIFVRVDPNNIALIRALITGPVGTPYEHGAFVFDLHLGAQFPAAPPQIHIRTTGNGTVRFNPNLYANGTVCLSLVGTWGGTGTERWSENSTLYQLLVSIQSLIMCAEPYFNEPGYETMAGTPQGQKASDAMNKSLCESTKQWAIRDWVTRAPSTDFDHIARHHFNLTKPDVSIPKIDWLKGVYSAK